MAFLFLLQIAGAVMLLLYAVRMVRTGFERATGPALRRSISRAASGPLVGVFSGMTVAVMLQSATAVTVLAAGLALSGILTTSAGLAVLLGADLGSALVVQFLVFDLSWLVPLLLAVGAWLFLKIENRTVKQAGRILIGIALVLIALQMIGESTTPLKQARFMPHVAAYLASDMFTALAVGALLAFLMHSSVATVLMVAAFAQKAVLPLEAAIPLVLGANIGAGLVALWLTRGMDRTARLLPLGNFIFRFAGAVVTLLLLTSFQIPLEKVSSLPAQQLVAIHILFNLVLVLVCVPLTSPMAWLVERILPEQVSANEAEPNTPKSALDQRVFNVPRLALASATRELLRMGELVEAMTRPVMMMLDNGSIAEIRRLQQMDTNINVIHSDIKLYVAELNRGRLTSEEAERSLELASFAINLERAGDLVSKNLLERAVQLQKSGISFSKEGQLELESMHDRVLANMQLALNVLVSGDVASARELIAEKDMMRQIEKTCHEQHLDRLKSRMPESIETSNAHMEVVRSLKEINSLFATVGVPILAREGQLRNSRLVPAQ